MVRWKQENLLHPKPVQVKEGSTRQVFNYNRPIFLHSKFDLNISALVNIYLYEIQNFVIKVFYFNEPLETPTAPQKPSKLAHFEMKVSSLM